MAQETALAVLPIIADYTIVPIKTHVCYALYCKTSLQNLKEKVEEFKASRDELRSLVDEQRRNGKTIHENVTEWLQEVEAMIGEMERQIEDDENRRKKKCFIGLCPDFITRYKLGKNAKKELATVAEKLEQKPRFDSIAYHAPPRAMDVVPNIKGYETMGSRNKSFGDIMNALKVAEGKMIGVYGMGGIGKTTLVKVVAREALEQQLFDKVAIATVTQNPDTMRIQQEIGDQLGITFKDKVGKWGRACQLRDWLKEQKKTLIVLDDLWERLDLEEVGISFQDEQKDCKVLLTSREFDVLSMKMDVQNNFSIGVLEKQEAWDLFKKTAGGNVEDPEVHPIAEKISEKCGGLPVAIVTIAKALKDKSSSEWNDALHELQTPSTGNFTGRVSGEVYRALELSYQHLRSEELKSTFLLCSRMGYNASMDDLLKYAVGSGLFPDHVTTIKAARHRASSLVNELKNSCLLLDGNTSNQFSIHDVVRDVAISIAFRDHAIFVKGPDEVQMEGHGRNSHREYKEIWLHGDCISRIFEDMNCKKVEIFIFKSEDPSLEIREVFGEMEKLKVIGLTNLSFFSMSSSLHLLSNLHSLCIHQSSLEEISIIGQLKQLEVLSFVESTLKHLPEEIGKLKKLKLLDLTNCSELEEIAPNVISNLSLLQELYLGNSFHHWNIGENNASLMELEHLPHLINLDIHVPDSNIISKDLFSKNLERYRILIGDVWDWHDINNETSRTLKLKFGKSKDHLKPGIPMLLKRTEDLYLLEVEGVKNVVYELDIDGFPLLKNLHIHNSRDIQYVIDTMDEILSNDPLFSSLESLFLSNLSSIKSIHHGEFVARSFVKLQILKVESCVELKYLFFFSTGRGVEVTRCRNMDVLMEFPQLRSICLKDLSNLRGFCSAESLESGHIISEEESIQLFDEKIVFPKLEDLQLESIPNIKRVWSRQLSEATASIQNLQRLEVKNCQRLEYIFSLPMVKSLVQLKHLFIWKCNSVKEIIETGAVEETKKMLVFPKLEDIKLVNLPKLGRFCTGCLIECPLLKTLSIQHCPKMETFISDCERREVSDDDEGGEVELGLEKCRSAKQPLFNEKVAFPSLARLDIHGLPNLEKIWNNQQELAPGAGSCFYDQLRSVSVGGCRKLVNIFPSTWLRRFQRLEELSINACDSLEEVFEGTSSSSSVSSSFQLRDLSLFFLPELKHIWNKNLHGMLPNFHNLHTVRVYRCNGLKNLFPFSIATDSLQQLEKLEIQYCEGLEEMVAKAEELGDHGEAEAAVPRFQFPQLTSFELEKLPKYRNVYAGKHSWECQRLKSFRVIGCPNVKVFGSKSQSIKGLLESQYGDDPIQPQQSLFLVEKVICSLEELSLNGWENTTATSILWQPHLLAAERSYSKLKVLNLQDFGRESDCPVPFNFLQRLSHLETLKVEYCSLKKLFSYEGFVEEEQTQRVAQLKNLVLEDVDDITSSREQEHQRLFSLFHHLKTLRVHSCYSLVNLAPFSTSFQNLSTLEVGNCSRLSNLITSSTAKSLVQLVKLIITGCDGMIEMVAKEEDETEVDDEIVFNKLEYLELLGLGNLQSFCSANCIFKFPSLKEVIVERCPKMLIFSPKAPSTPKLQAVCWQRNTETRKCWQGDLNATITEMLMRSKELLVDGAHSNADSVLWHQEPHFYSSFEVLKLQNFKRKSDPLSFGLLKKLDNVTTLSVNKSSLQRLFLFEGFDDDEERARILARLRNLILDGVDDMWEQDHPLAPLLHNLVTLRVRSCDSLVTLAPISSASFQNLSTLDVSCCSALSNLITSSTAKRSFAQLVKLTISWCSGMTEIVAKDEVGDGILIDDGEIVFDKLEYLELQDLEKLTSFSPTNYTFKFPSLKEVIVGKCPQMLIFSPKAPSTPKLEGVCWQRYTEIKRFCLEDNNLNTTITKMLMSSKELSVDGARSNADSVLWHQEPHFYSSFEVLKLQNFKRKSDPFSFDLLKKLHNVTTLSVENSSLQRLFLFEGFDDEDDMWNLWEQERQLVPLLHNLVTLQVKSCCGLVPNFQNLSTLDVSWCSGLSNLITSSTAKSSFVQLFKLTISYCNKMTEIVAKDEVGDGMSIDDGEIVFNKLKNLKLKHLDSLTSFSPTNYTFKFPSLNEVLVEACPKMLIFSPKIPNTPKLQEVRWQTYPDKISCWEGNLNATIQHLYTEMVGLRHRWDLKLSDFPQLKERWHNQLPLNLFSNLKNLVVDDCAFVCNAMSYNQLQLMDELSNLQVRNCNSLEKVFDLEGINAKKWQARLLPELEELQLTNLPNLRHIYNMGLSPSFIEGSGKEIAAVDKIVFPALKVIVLDSLPVLTTIFSEGSGILQFPLLEEISVENCPNLKTFVSSLVREQIPISVNEGKEYRLQKPDHDTVSFRNMKKLGVEWNDIMEIVCSGQFRAEYFSKLEGLSLMHFPYDLMDFPSRFLQRFINLKELSIKDASFKEIIFYEGEKHIRILAQLEVLKLSKLSKLMHLPDEDSLTSQRYKKLETLRVLECGMLDILIPSSLSFQCLTVLEVSKCHKLLNLMTSSSVKNLKQLKSMTITECEMIEEIMVKEENEVRNEVIFHNLQELRLECLSSLTSFHLGKCAFMFPSLEKVVLIECPKMKLFSGGVISTPKLVGVVLTEEDYVGYWEDDLNSTVQKLYFEMSDVVAQFKQPSAPIHPTLTCETTQVDGNGSTNVLERQVFEDLHTTGTPETSKDLPPVVATIFKNKESGIKVVSTDSKITQITSSSQDFDEASNDKGQNSSTSIDSDTQIHEPLQKDPHASEKDESSLDNVVFAVSFEQSNTIPLSPGTSVERVSLSTCASSSNRTSSQDPTVVCADSSCPTSVFQRQVSEDLHSTRTIETSKDLPAVVAPIIKKKETFVLTESKNTRIASSFQDFNTASSEKGDPTQGEKPSTSMAYKPRISLLVQKDSQTIEKDQPSPDNVISGVSLQQRDTSPLSSGTSIEQVSMSTSASSTHSTSSQDLTFRNAACSDTPTETLQSYGASFKQHRASIELIKKLVMKPPAEVAASSDYFLLMSSLKNLKNCASLNSQEQEIVRFYLENFPSLVTNNPFDEQKIDCTSSIKISIEDHKKKLAELDISKNNLTIEINRLSATKDELNKQLRAIQEEEDLLQAKKKILLVQIGSREGQLEIEMDALLEAERHKIETEDKASRVNENWAKLRNLSA